MKTRNILFTCFLLLSATLSGQKSLDIYQPDNVSKSYVARDYVRLHPGYSFNSTGGKTLYLGINEHLLEQASYQSLSQIPNPYRSLNTNYAVGSVAGEASVSPTGAAVYQIPIEVMPGTGGVQPNISVVYNSQSGNGLMGYGWNLSAVSAITRVGKTFYHDGAAAVPDLTSNDNLMFDGQRLMRASGSNLLASSTYKTEIETYLDITCKTINTYLGFEVKNREGWTLEYGSSADSYIKPNGGSVAYAWLLKKVTDANGNYMTYTYDNDAATGEFRLKQIDYTGNANANPVLNPYNKIEFFYETRTDKSTAYIAGKSVEQSVILKRIKCSAYNSTIRDYRFNYYYDGYQSKLTEVEEYGMYGMRYNSTIVDWGDNIAGYTGYAKRESLAVAIFSESRYDNVPIYVDFNSDGREDFISVSNQGQVKLFLNENCEGDMCFQKVSEFTIYGDNYKGIIPADLNGDGFVDLIAITLVPNNTYRYNYYFFDGTTFSNGGGSGYKGFNTTVKDDDYVVGDFNGDGKHEILIKSTMKLYDEAGNYIQTSGISNWGVPLNIYCPNNLNITGSGKTNICIQNGSNGYIYELNGTIFTQILSTNQINNASAIYAGDYNGDGKTDLFVRKKNQNSSDGYEYYWLLSTGNSFARKDLPSLVGSGQNALDGFSGDFNLDGKMDFAILGYYTLNYSTKKYYRFKIGINNGSGYDFIIYDTNIEYNGVPNIERFNVADFDGDGRLEFCELINNNANCIYSFDDAQRLSVKNIINGLNQKISFQYNPITDKSAYSNYTESTTSYTFPVSKFRKPLYVVKNMETVNGNQSSITKFSYKNARIHKQGKGFLGFEEVIASNSIQKRKTATQYGYDIAYFNVFPVKQTITTTSNDSISRTNLKHNYYTITYNSGLKTLFPYLESQITVDKLTGISKKTDYVYASSDHGNPNKITETQGSLITETSYTWVAKKSSYKNRPEQQTTVKKGIGTTFSEIKKFEYDANARLTKKIDYYGNAKAVTTVYSNFDSFGNPRTMTTTSPNCPTVTNNTVYDIATGRFVEKHTDALNNASYERRDPATGVLLESTDIAGLKTFYQYDGFQRPVQEISPVDRIDYSTVWDISGNSLYKTTAQSLISGAQTSWYNALGQEIKKQTQGFSGTVVSEKVYNEKGQLTHSYLPGYTNKSTQCIEYGYDKFGRIELENNIGRTTTYSYNTLTTTVTAPDGKTNSTTLNLSGLVANSTDAANNLVTYTYNSLGKPETVISNGIATYIKYDDRGFQQVLKDANLADSVKYVYDAYGQLASQTNARGQVTSFQYDAAGRVTQESCPERTLTYQYVPSGNGIGQIQTIKQNNAVVRTYGYTSLGQVSSATEKIDNVDYATSYTYNGYGQMIERQSPSGMRVSYQYNNTGLLTSMRNVENNALLWQLDAANALGQITESTMGNGLKRISGYDSYYLPNQILLKNGSTVLDQVNYTFNNKTGNLTTRNDISNSRNETFGYDVLNRLDSLRLNNGALNRVLYHPNGNINTKFDVGTYQYEKGNHAVSGIINQVSAYNPPALDITNTSYNRVSSLTQQGSVVKKLNFQYNADKQRNKTLYYENNTLKKTMIYVGNYEKEVISGGSTKEYDYLYTPEGLSAIAVKTNGTRSLYYVQTDHLGSIRVVTTEAKAIQTRYYYDAWGKQTVTSGTSITNRGYIGQEHLNDFGLLNLNARLYDPVLGRFMGVDPFVSMPDFTQSYNRYAYGMNNPLCYVDADGEFPWLAALVVAGYTYLFNAKENTPKGKDPGNPANWGYNPGNWFKEGGRGFYVTGGYNPNGGDWNISASYFNGGFQITGGVAGGNNYFSYGGGVSNNGYGVSYYRTNFGSSIGPDGRANMQTIGEIGLQFRGYSVRLANDFLGDFKDRWRSNAIELGVGDLVLGTFLYNNNPKGEGKGYYKRQDDDYVLATDRMGNYNKTFGGTEYSAWKEGKTYTSPAYIAYRRGSNVLRLGYSHPVFQDRTQNWVHRNGFLYLPFGHQHFYNDYSEFQKGNYFYSGYHNPYSLY